MIFVRRKGSKKIKVKKSVREILSIRNMKSAQGLCCRWRHGMGDVTHRVRDGKQAHRPLPWREGGKQLRCTGSSIGCRTNAEATVSARLPTYPRVAPCLTKGGVRSQVTESGPGMLR